MATTIPFNDLQNGAEIRERLNAMWADWLAALETAVGKDGWSPLLRPVAHGQRQVIELYDWFGGATAKPATGFMGADGLVATAAEAVDFRGLKGDEGDIGPQGPANKLGVGDVTTGAPGSPVQVTITGNYPDQKINITIPRGDTGDNGDTPTVTVGDVTTGAPGTAVEVTPGGTPTALVLNFKIPRGEKGESGSGTGDMLKSVYDPTGSGRVQRAAAAPWAGIEDMPAFIAAGATEQEARAALSLESVDNTPDAQKPVSAAQQAVLDQKVEKVAGKVLSANDFTNTERVKLANISEQATKNAPDAELRDRSTHTGTQAISTITGLETALEGKQAVLESGVTVKTLNGVPILGSGDIAIAAGSAEKKFYFHTGASHTFTVPAGVSVVRFYAGGRGGDGRVTSVAGSGAAGGGGGGFAFGDLSVLAGDEVSVSFSSGQGARVALNGTTVGHALDGGGGAVATGVSIAAGGLGGTATITAAVTNGGAYSGGAGGRAQGNNTNARGAGGGGSCGSPLGAGFRGGDCLVTGSSNAIGAGGGGIGGTGADNGLNTNEIAGGGGAGQAGTITYGGGSRASGTSRGLLDQFADALLKHATGPSSVSGAFPGSGGFTTAGGDFGGGPGAGMAAIPRSTSFAGGLMGGGGGVANTTTGAIAGAGGYGGGGGGANAPSGAVAGSGGAAFCFFYY